MTYGGAPYTDAEWEAVRAALATEREARRARHDVDDSGVVRFSQPEQAELARETVRRLRDSANDAP